MVFREEVISDLMHKYKQIGLIVEATLQQDKNLSVDAKKLLYGFQMELIDTEYDADEMDKVMDLDKLIELVLLKDEELKLRRKVDENKERYVEAKRQLRKFQDDVGKELSIKS
jgi:hypothetical protein